MKTKNLDDVYELTPMQQGMLFHHLCAPDEGFYVEQTVLTLTGVPDPEAFWRSWQFVVDRHPALRSSFHWDGISKPVQAVHGQVRLERDEVDWRGFDPDKQDRLLDELLRGERRRGFDLEDPPIMRVTLCRLADDRFHIALRFSHLVVDGWSVGIILSEFTTAYKAFHRGGEPVLAAPARFRDYVGWWKRHAPSAVEPFWRDYLAGYAPPAPVHLASAGAASAAASDLSGTFGWVDLSLADLADDLRAFSQRHKVTLHTLVQGAWTLVLARTLGVTDIAVGTTFAHRPADLPGAESIVGCLVGTVPVRSQLPADRPVLPWLREIQDGIIAGRDNAAAGLADIQEWSDAPRGTELFESIVGFQNMPLPPFTLGAEGLGLAGYSLHTRPHTPLVLMVLPGADLPMHLIHDRGRVDSEQARFLVARVRAALASIARTAPATVRDVEALDEHAPAASPGRAVPVPAAPASAAPASTVDLRAAGETERALATLMAELLKVDRVGVDDNLVELGLHSLLGTRAMNRIREEWKTAVPLRLLFESPTVASLARVIEAGGVAESPATAPRGQVDVVREATLDPAIAPGAPLDRPERPEHILLTGATGYLGTALLEQLLRTTNARVRCLVRARDGGDTQGRVREALAAAGRWDDSFAGRVDVLPGNLSQPWLGLDADTFARLADETDEIHHLGAVVNILPPYRRVKPTNVVGTREILRLATTGRLTPVHCLSPAEVTDSADPDRSGRETALDDRPPNLYNGYIQSKWVADRVLGLAQERGVPVAVYRAARLVGSPRAGRFKLGDVVSDIARGCARLGLVPESDVELPVSPVDYVAAGIAALARRPDSAGGYFHLTAGRPFRFADLAEAMTSQGYAVRAVPLDRWYAELVRLSQRDRDGGWDLVLSVLGPWVRATVDGWREPLYDATMARAALAGTVPCPVVDAEFIAGCLAHFAAAGHIPPPGPAALPGRPAHPAAALPAAEAAQRRDESVVREWEGIYDELYAGTGTGTAGFGADFSGWRSSYDGQPIPLPEMREWRAATVERIRSLAPSRVLEVGVGSGLLLAELAPGAATYWGTDLSGPVVERLTRQVAGRPELAGKVVLRHQPAHVVDGLPEEFFDTVVLNSVVQYFPSGDYLTDVIARVLRLLAPGGAVFLGDVRNLRLLPLLHTAVRAGRARPGDSAETLRREVSRAVALEKELLVDPDFFPALRQRLPELGAVDVRLKRGSAHNELTRHRYDVVLHQRPAAHLHPTTLWWRADVSTVDQIGAALAGRPPALRVAGIPNARLAGEAAAAWMMTGGEPVEVVTGQLTAKHHAVDPERLRELGQRHGYEVVTTWSGAAFDGSFDALFTTGPLDGPVAAYRPGGNRRPMVNELAGGTEPGPVPSRTGAVAR